MDVLVLLARLIHIVGGAFWVGSSLLVAFFVEPAVRAAGPEGSRFMQRLGGGPMSRYLTVASIATILAGLFLYWHDSGFLLRWILTGPGIAFTLGALAGISGLMIGAGITGPTINQLSALGRQVQAAGKPPTPDQQAELGRLGRRLSQASRWTAIAVTVAIMFMATARYWNF